MPFAIKIEFLTADIIPTGLWTVIMILKNETVKSWFKLLVSFESNTINKEVHCMLTDN